MSESLPAHSARPAGSSCQPVCSSRMISKICSTRIGARPIDGSSSIRSFGWLTSVARPMASICCSPPESVPAICLLRSCQARETFDIRCSRSSFNGTGAERVIVRPSQGFPRTVICEKHAAALRALRQAIAARSCWAGTLSIVVPLNCDRAGLRACSRPETVFRMVDFAGAVGADQGDDFALVEPQRRRP